MGYVHVQRAGDFLKVMERAGILEAFLKQAAAGNPARQGEIAAWLDLARQANALNVSLHWADAKDGDKKLDVLALVEHPAAESAFERLRAALKTSPAPAAGDVPVFSMETGGGRLLLGRSRNLLVASTHADLVAEALTPRRPLADSQAHLLISKGLENNQVQAYLSVSEVLATMSGRRGAKVGLAQAVGTDAVFLAQELDDPIGTIRCHARPGSLPATLLSSESAQTKRFGRVTPADASFAVGLSVRDGAATFDQVMQALRKTVDPAAERDVKRGVDRDLDRFEAEIGIRLSSAAALVTELGWFMSGRSAVMFAFVKDQSAAEALLADMLPRVQTEKVRAEGLRIVVKDRLAWCLAEDCVLMATDAAPIQRVLAARGGQNTLDSLPGFRDLVAKAGAKGTALVWVNGQAIAAGLGRGGEEDARRPTNPLAAWIERQQAAVSVTAKDGLVDCRVARNQADPEGLLSAVKAALEGQDLRIGAPAGDAPVWVAEQRVTLITANPPYRVQEFRLGDVRGSLMPPPKETDAAGYGRRPTYWIEAQAWTRPMRCAACGQDIPRPSASAHDWAREGMNPPVCPLCSKTCLPATPAPAQPAPAQAPR
jgi:hypothetical protein